MGVVPEKLPDIKLSLKLSPNIPSAAGAFFFCYTGPKLLCSLFVSCYFFTSEPLRCRCCVARSPLPAPPPLFIFLGLTLADPTLTHQRKKKTPCTTHTFMHTPHHPLNSLHASCPAHARLIDSWSLWLTLEGYIADNVWQRWRGMEKAVRTCMWETDTTTERQSERKKNRKRGRREKRRSKKCERQKEKQMQQESDRRQKYRGWDKKRDREDWVRIVKTALAGVCGEFQAARCSRGKSARRSCWFRRRSLQRRMGRLLSLVE